MGGSGCGVGDLVLGCTVFWDSSLEDPSSEGFGCARSDLGFQISGAGFRDQGFGFRASGILGTFSG